ncbi:hypothetical protein HID58_083577 [Brassica napus]|uniref:Kinesin motor domain-containing protein n=1 Tax=Brassica napus TaxID=3708 RepID=A0ABQ7YGN7_BRANA|nr:hypothetical protein HID58_083577 [Brassica napus]
MSTTELMMFKILSMLLLLLYLMRDTCITYLMVVRLPSDVQSFEEKIKYQNDYMESIKKMEESWSKNKKNLAEERLALGVENGLDITVNRRRKLFFILPSNNIFITIFMVEASAENPHLFISSISSADFVNVLYVPLLGATPSSPIFLNNKTASGSEPFLHNPPIIILYIILFCSRNATKQSTEINDGRQRTRLNHRLEQSNSIILLDTNNPTSQSLFEAKSINLSLSALGKCINALAENTNHLTRLLRDSFGAKWRRADQIRRLWLQERLALGVENGLGITVNRRRKLFFILPSDNISITIFMVEAFAENPHLFISSISFADFVKSPSRRCALIRVLYVQSFGAIPSSSIFLHNMPASDSDPFLHNPPIIVVYVLTVMRFGITSISTIRSTNSTALETLPTRHKPLIKVENAAEAIDHNTQSVNAMCNPLQFHLLAEIQHKVILFRSGYCTKQFIEIHDRRKRTRPDHGLKQINSILLLDTNNPTSQSLSVR